MFVFVCVCYQLSRPFTSYLAFIWGFCAGGPQHLRLIIVVIIVKDKAIGEQVECATGEKSMGFIATGH